MRRARSVLWAAAVCWAAALHACGQVAPRRLTPVQQKELETLTGQLSDSSRSAKTKREAADLLLGRGYSQASEALRAFLADRNNPPAQIAVAEAIADRGGGSTAFIKPLTAMLIGAEPSVRAAAARALVTYKNRPVLDRLIGIVGDRRRDKQVRLVTIAALHRVLDKKAVDALVRLLDDADAEIRDAAAESLGKLTNIRAFGKDRVQWKRWWAHNRHKARTQWLADLAESLAKTNTSLESANAVLRGRLAKAMMDLYAAAPPAQRDAMLLSFLKDSLGDVRLVGAKLTDRKIGAGQGVSKEIRAQVRAMLPDEDRRVREAAAMLVANLPNGATLKVLLGRLTAEQAPTVRQALLKAIGQLRDPNALPAIIAEIHSKYDAVSASAAAAVGRIAGKHPLRGKQRSQASRALLERWEHTGLSGEQTPLREALLAAMGVVGDKAFVPALQRALKDPNATIRHAAVKGIAQLGHAELASMLVPLSGDADRGVRQAAIDALAALGGRKQLQTILLRTNPASESDAAVRRQAWAAALRVLAEADPDLLRKVADGLVKRPDAADERIKILQMLVDRLKTKESPSLLRARRQLGAALVAASRPTEAAPQFRAAYEFLRRTKDKQAPAAWNEWIDAMLAADDPACAKAMAQQGDKAAFSAAMDRLTRRLTQLKAKGNHLAVILLAGEAAGQLAKRISPQRLKQLQQMRDEAGRKQRAADRQQVAALVARLLTADESARKAAGGQLQAMGDRAVAPLLMELRKTVSAAKVNTRAEKSILAVLAHIAPKLVGYDPAADKAARLKKIDEWLKGK